MQPPAARSPGPPTPRPPAADAGLLLSDRPLHLTHAIELPTDRVLALCGSKGLAAYLALCVRAERGRCHGRTAGRAPSAPELEALMGCSRPYRVLIQELLQHAGVLSYRYRSVPGDRFQPPHQVLDYRLLAPPAQLDWATVDAVLDYCAAHDKAAAYLAANGGIFSATITVDAHGAWGDLLPLLIEDARWETIFTTLHGGGKHPVTPDDYRLAVAAWLAEADGAAGQALRAAITAGPLPDTAHGNSVSPGSGAHGNSVYPGSDAQVNSVSLAASAQVNSVSLAASAHGNSVYPLINQPDPTLTQPSNPTEPRMDGWMGGSLTGESLLYEVPATIPPEIAALFQDLNADRVSIVEWLELAQLATTPADWQLVGYVLLRARQRKHGAPTRMTASYVARGLTEARRKLTPPPADADAPLLALLDEVGVKSVALRRELVQAGWVTAAIVTTWTARMRTMAEHGYVFADAGAWLATRLRTQEAPIDEATAVAWGTQEARKRPAEASAAILDRARESGFFAPPDPDPATMTAAEATAALRARLWTVPALAAVVDAIALPTWHAGVGDAEAIVVEVADPALQTLLQQHEARIAEEVALLADRRTCTLVFRFVAAPQAVPDDPRRPRWIPLVHWGRLAGSLQGLLLGSRRQGRQVIAGDHWRQDRLGRYQTELAALLDAIARGEEP